MIPKLTKEQAAVIGAYTGITCGPFADIQEYVEKLMGRPVWTHELPALKERIEELAKPDFISICYEEN